MRGLQFPARLIFVLIFWLITTAPAFAGEGVLGENQRIFSQHLGYELQYRVYIPGQTSTETELPSLYVTDGQAFLEQGKFKSVLDEAISAGKIAPVSVIFLDSRNPDDLGQNRRTSEFMCNPDYARFFATELVPEVSRSWPISPYREDRVILGVSFGGLNSACFGLMLSDLFSGIAMQSPASGDHVEVVRKLYEEEEKLPLKMYVSVGTINDNLKEVKRFKRTLEDKGYDLTYTRVRKGHDWDNWGPLLGEVLTTFYGVSE